jgi:phosphoglycolate phosphatase-like HAD superfamily hydrolase
MAKKIFIFDYDGVIADSLDMCIEAFNTLKKKYGFPGELTKEAIEKLPHVTAEAAFGLLGVSAEDRHLYTGELMTLLQANAIKAKIFNGIGDIFRMVKESGAYLAINTANGSGTVKKRLQMAGLAELPDYIVGADTPGNKSEKIAHIMEKLSADPDDTYMIGDSMGDITEGRKAGAHTIAVTYGWQPRATLEAVNPEYICDTMEELKMLVQKKSRV